MFSCFLDVRKAFDTVWIDGSMCKLFSDYCGLAIKDSYTDVNPSFTKGGGGGLSRPSKGFSSITFEKNKLETPHFA